MKKNALPVIQTICNIAKILSKILFVFSIVGAVLCIVAMISLSVGSDKLFTIGGITVFGLMDKASILDERNTYLSLATSIVSCIGYMVMSGFSGAYFKNELAAGTPFTFDGAKEMMRLGIIIAAVSAGVQAINSLIVEVFATTIKLENYNEGTVIVGVLMIAMSLLMKLGAEQAHKNEINDIVGSNDN